MAAAATEPPAERSPSRRPGVDPLSGGLLLTTFAAAALGWLVAVVLGRELAPRGKVWLSVTAAVATLVAALTLSRRTPAHVSLGALAFLGVPGAVLPYERALGASPWAWNGLAGNQTFRTEYLTRFAGSPALADYTYADLPAFHPPAWFWVGGQVAHLTGVPAWQLMRPATTVTVVLMVGVGTLLARPALGTRAAALGVALAAAFGTATLWEPYLLLAGSSSWAASCGCPTCSPGAPRALAASQGWLPGSPPSSSATPMARRSWR